MTTPMNSVLDRQTTPADTVATAGPATRPPAIRHISPAQLKSMMDAGGALELIDVRTTGEREIAVIDGSRLLDERCHDALLAMDRSTPIVFVCHHGVRSQAAAHHYLREGFRNLHNLLGGIDAWSREIDPTVPKY
jgi:monothiol glutaredoxin